MADGGMSECIFTVMKSCLQIVLHLFTKHGVKEEGQVAKTVNETGNNRIHGK